MRVLNDKLMQVISQIVRATAPPVAVVHSEEGTHGPLLVLGSIRGPHDVEHYGYPVLIVRANEPLVGVHRIGSDLAMSPDRAFRGRLIEDRPILAPHRDDDLVPRPQGQRIELRVQGVAQSLG
jgi:hypothetical protein